MNSFTRPMWNMMSEQEQQDVLYSLLPTLPEGFSLKQLQRFERYGQQFVTGIFVYKEKEFVFVPGDTVTLGWNNGMGQMDAKTRENLGEALVEIERTLSEADELLNQQMSPVREAVIGPMLVERYPKSIGWLEVMPTDLNPEEDADIIEQLHSFEESRLNSYEVHEDYRLEREGDQIRIYLFNETEQFEDWSADHLHSHFAIPNEDEWEYLYGGGCRTLFPWGDSFDYTMNIRHFGNLDDSSSNKGSENSSKKQLYHLELPNIFGLCFLGDPYQIELTVDNGHIRTKGGDGGAGICGGSGVILGYLPVATYYRNIYDDTLDWVDLIGYMHYRRIIRLS
ncbi:hypothetical protein [Paenibacillus bovis]|uniref:Sulfatase-modifying factor enzyme domain-containing protein n=1 Tax=Paenibacillus bovis TaxID=1616788 RepID=A0A172ZEH4_9BACL|nr:hypothetical protein [Paenibacillus bovis]ANF95560.1 hypothetical protein AR543_05735 [Paenibacillus bovis]